MSGEAQKIALARALYKNAPFIILDEPTAALDPLAVYEVYTKFNEIVGDKTAIYISHRLSFCRFCDTIAVFEKSSVAATTNWLPTKMGCITASGTCRRSIMYLSNYLRSK